MKAREIDEITDEYIERMWGLMTDDFVRIALDRAINSYRANRERAFKLFPETVEKAEKLRKVKEYSLQHIDELIKLTRDRIEDLKGNCFIAEKVEDAVEYVKDVAGSGSVIVKSKSMTAEELNLNEELESMGCQVYETDLGEFLIQLLRAKPMHILSPAIHVSREKAAEILSKKFKKHVPAEIPAMVAEVRNFLRKKYFEANVGISGANAVAAETGTVFIIENEGNARLVTGLPEKHVVITGIEKIVPTLQDGMLAVEVTSRYANYKAPSYVSLISCPSKTGDIEKTIVHGAHGPREYHVVLLNNNRKEIIKSDVYRQALLCLRCGACLYECGVYPVTAGSFGYVYMGGLGALLTRYLVGGIKASAPIAFTCTLCGRCKEFCPMKIDTPQIVLRLRRELKARGLVPSRIIFNLEKEVEVKLD